MTEVAALAVEPAPLPPSRPEIRSRFGPIAFDAARTITIPKGLFGFPGRVGFALADVPEREVPFKLLQAVGDAEVGFLVLPLDRERGPIARRDLEPAARGLGLAWRRLAVLAIVTLRAEAGGLRCTMNLKAPILIDTERLLGCQCVLASEAYDLRHPLPLGAEHAG